MSTLSERAHRGAAPAPSQVAHARRLVADWQLLADLAFADLTLWVPLRTGAWWCVAQVRPPTAPPRQPQGTRGRGGGGPRAAPRVVGGLVARRPPRPPADQPARGPGRQRDGRSRRRPPAPGAPRGPAGHRGRPGPGGRRAPAAARPPGAG